jgi:hypothetical protein
MDEKCFFSPLTDNFWDTILWAFTLPCQCVLLDPDQSPIFQAEI